jgi:hypothetical protein
LLCKSYQTKDKKKVEERNFEVAKLQLRGEKIKDFFVKNNDNILDLTINLDKIIDYIFHDISQNEELSMEIFFDNYEDLATYVDNLLDFCLANNYTKISLQFFIKMNAAPALNNILDNIKSELSKIQKERINAEITKKQEAAIFTKVIQTAKKVGQKIVAKRFTKVLFTLLLVINIPFLTTNTEYKNTTSTLKASNQQQVQELMSLTDYEIRYMRVDMLDERPITDFMTAVAIPTTFELRYITAD